MSFASINPKPQITNSSHRELHAASLRQVGAAHRETLPIEGTSRSSYGEIFKSTFFIGGASLIGLALGIIRTKIMAVYLGPAGVGLAGVYSTLIALASTLAGMGISSSGVRQIAEAAASLDNLRIARTTAALRRTTMILGMAGGILVALLSLPLSVLTFGNGARAVSIATLGLAVFLGAVAAGQAALLQGLRRVADLARINVLGAAAPTLIVLPLFLFLGEDGIVPLLVIVPALSLVVSWSFARRVRVLHMTLTWQESVAEVRALLGLGLVFMGSALMSSLVAYVIRLLIVRQLGMAAAGHYSAAYTISGIYAGFILQAMGTDFYPRLTAVASHNPTVNRLVNEQTEIALLLAVPGVLATLVLAPWVIHIFYAGGFSPAADVLRWQVLGILGRVISWPMGFILLAKGRRSTFIWTEVVANAVHLGLAWLALRRFGLTGTGMAFAGLYLFYALLILVVSRHETGFRWSAVNTRLLAWMLPLVAAVFGALHTFPPLGHLSVGVIATGVAGWICLKAIVHRVPAPQMGRLGLPARLV